MDLTTVCPVAAPVSIAGAAYLIPPLRLRDMAALQGWLKYVAEPCPLAAHRPAIARAEGRDRQVLAARAYLACEAWPAAFGSEAAAAHWRTPGGQLVFLRVATDRATPRPTTEELAGWVRGLSPAEWADLSAACWGSDPAAELAAILEPPGAGSEAPGPFNWGKAFAEVAELTGWTFSDISELTLSQWKAIRTRGEAGDGGAPPRPGETFWEAAQRRSSVFAEAQALGPLVSGGEPGA